MKLTYQRRRTSLRITILLSGALLASCAAGPQHPEPIPLETPIRVLVLGDSISIGYTPHLRRILGDDALVARPMKEDEKHAENCAGTNNGVGKIADWLARDGGEWDVIHFNFGLHDLKRVDPESGKNSNERDDPHQADPERYREQLEHIVNELEETGARLVFATTTPVPDTELKPYREPADVLLYNRIALEVMAAHSVVVNDLYSSTLARLDELQKARDVHFSVAGSEALAQETATAIRELAGLPAGPERPWSALVQPGSLDGWHATPGGEWRWQGTALTGTSEKAETRHGLLISDERFGNFEARLEFRTIAGCSGFYFRVDEKDDHTGVAGFQAEVDPSNETGGLYETGGRAWVMKPDPAVMQEIYRAGEWSEMRVTAIGGDIEVRVNGHVTAALQDDPGRREGHFALQLHGNQDLHVEFRDLWIRAGIQP